MIRKLLHYFNLDAELDDFNTIHETITRDIVFKGTNLWILIFAIVIASVGLNMNSTAVVIGAMLISPLMGPINGIGYSIATYNFPLLRRSLKNFGFAVGASLAASTLYFALSPISTAHSELLSRTSPTIYDVLIALFGGLAGIVAITSKQKGNVIPGVAIATALMPPLCTAGYGLATGNIYYFSGAMYLFTINSVFIALSSVVISQILKFPIRTDLSDEKKVRVNRLTSVITVLILIPSIYFGYNLVQKEKFSEAAARYVSNVSIIEGNYLLKDVIDPLKRNITLVYAGETLNESQKDLIRDRANDFNLRDVTIVFRQGLAFDSYNSNNAEVENLKLELNRLNTELRVREEQIDNIRQSGFVGAQLFDEIVTLYPRITSVSYSEAFKFNDRDEPEKRHIVLLTVRDGELSEEDQKRVQRWLKSRLDAERITVYYELE